MTLDPSLVAALGEMPQFLRQAAARLPPARLAAAPREGGFALVEHACHLRDFEAEGCLVRIARILAEDEPILLDFPGDLLAVERRYREQDFAAALQAFERRRARAIEILGGLSGEQLARTAEFGTIGRITLRRLVEMAAEHDATHRQEIAALIAEIGAPASA